nr:band 7 protein AGAP004871 [Drosophila bipectinata]
MKKETDGNKTPPDEPPQQEFRRPSDGDGKGVPTSRYIKTTEGAESSKFEKVAVALCWMLVVLTFPISMLFCLLVVPENRRIVVLRLGRLKKGLLGPGLVFYLPCIDSLHKVDLRTRVTNVRPQDVLTKDSVTITVNAVVYYCIYNPIDSIIQVDDFRQATQMISQVTLRNVVGSKTLNILLTSRQALSREIQVAVAGITARWGVRVERVDVMDIVLPPSLERSLASEAEAVREARAKIILAEGELKASKALKEASDVMSENRITLQLRHLQILSSIATERRVRIIYPIPLEIMEPFMKDGKKGGDANDGDGKDGNDKDGGANETAPIAANQSGGGVAKEPGGVGESRSPDDSAHNWRSGAGAPSTSGLLSNMFFGGPRFQPDLEPIRSHERVHPEPSSPGPSNFVPCSTDFKDATETSTKQTRSISQPPSI